MVSKSYSMGLWGMHAFLVEVETDISAGLPAFDLVGLPDAAVKESRNRVRAALKNCGFDFPVSRITMNLAPADRRKEGPIYDLPLLISLLKVTGQLGAGTDGCVFPCKYKCLKSHFRRFQNQLVLKKICPNDDDLLHNIFISPSIGKIL